MSEQVITGDLGGVKSGFRYQVFGADANCESGNSSWKQKNMDNNRERTIFRFDSSTFQFAMIKQFLGVDQTAKKKSLIEVKLLGTQAQIDLTEAELTKLFKDPTNHQASFEIGKKPLNSAICSELASICKSKF